MSDYINRQDAIDAINAYQFGDGRLDCYAEEIVAEIEDIPAIDVVEVIRCKDCRFFRPDTYSDNWCSAKSPGVTKGMCTPSGDSYCSDAERKTEQDV